MWNKLTGKNSDAASQSGEKEKRRSKTGESGSSRSERRRAESVISSASTSRRSERGDRDRDRDGDGERKKRSSASRTSTYPPPESVASSYATAPSTRDREERTPRRSATMPVDDGVSTYSYENVHSWDRPQERDDESVYGVARDREEERRRAERESDSPRDREERRKERRERREAERSAPLKRDSDRKASRTIVEESSRASEDMPGAFPGQSTNATSGPSRPEPQYSTSDPHIAHQFPGMTPANPYGAAADFYGDQGQSVAYQPGVRPDTPLMNAQLHLMAASAQAQPAQDTGNGSAADYFAAGAATAGAISGAAAASSSSSKPTKPSSGTPSKPSKTNSKPSGSGKMSTAAAAAAGGAALGYALNSNAQESSSSLYVHGAQETASNAYQQSVAGASSLGGHGHSLSAPSAGTYGVGGDSDASPRVSPSHSPSRPGKSNFGKYAAGAAGLAAGAYALHNHNHSHHQHTSSAPGGHNGYNGYDAQAGYGVAGSSGYVNGHNHTHNHGQTAMRSRNQGPVSKLVDWWKDHEDVAKMEEYTEYIGVCRGCFDPNTSAYMAPRKHNYRKRKSTDSLRERRSGEFERGGRVSKDSRYYRYGSDEEKRRKSNKAGLVAAGLGAYGLAKAGKAVLGEKGDFEDTYSVRSGRRAHSSKSYARHGSRSRSSSRDRRSSYGVIRRRGSSSSDQKRSRTDLIADGKGEYRLERRRSDKKKNRSRSSSRDRRSGGGILGAAAGAALAGGAIAASRRKHHSRSRSRSNSPSHKNYAYVRRHRGDNDNVSVYSQATSRHRGSRASLGSSREDLPATGGFLGGIFGASGSDRRRRISPKRKKKTGFFTFGNGSSSSDLGLAYGGDARRGNRSSRYSLDGKRKVKRKSSDEKINATLLGIGATAAALAAAQHGRGKHGGSRADLVAVKERKGHRTRGSLVSKPTKHSSSDEDDGGVWEDDPNDSSGYSDEGLAYGDWRARKSTDSLVSNDSGTWKWGWRWGRKKKRPSRESLGAGGSFIAPAAAGAAAGAVAANMIGRHDGDTYSPSLSSQPSMQSVVPIMSNDPTRYDAVGRRTDSLPMYSSPHQNLPLNQPQPVAPVNGAVYNTTGVGYSPGYVAPSGPPVDFNASTGLVRRDSRDKKQRPVSYSAADLARRQSAPVDDEQAPSLPARRRRASSPVQSSSNLGRNALIGSAAAAAGIAAASALSSSGSKQPGTPSKDVRFSFDAEQAGRERDRDREHDRESARESRRREEDDAAERRKRDDERRQREEEEQARAYARQEEQRAREEEARAAAARREAERKADAEREAARRAAVARETEERERLEREADRRRREREAADREAAEREAAAQAASAREAKAREEAYRAEQELRAKEALAREEEHRLEQERREREAADREFEKRENERRANWAAPVAAGAAGIAAASVVSALSDSSRDGKKKKNKDKKRQDSIPLDSRYEVYRSEDEPSRSAQAVEPKIAEAKPVVREIKPIIDSKVEVDGFDDDVIFDPDYFKKARDKKRAAAEIALASKAADKVVADMKQHYDEGPVDNESFWAPAELRDHSQDRKLNDPNADADVEVLHEGNISVSVPPYDRDYSFTPVREVDSRVPWAVPQLKLIEPTPPASRANSYAGSYAGSARGSVPPSPVVEPQKSDVPVGEELERSRSGSRVRWGENQTQIFEAVTPDSIREKFISDDDITSEASPQRNDEVVVEEKSRDGQTKTSSYKPAMAASAAAAAAYGISKELVESPVEEELPRVSPLTGSPVKEDGPVYQSQSPEITPVVVEPNERRKRRSGGFYEQPFYDSISDMGTTFQLDEDAADLPTREHGFVEGEVFDPTPKEEKDLSSGMPGGFIEDEEAPAAFTVSSKKQKKKDKKAKKNREVDTPEPETVSEAPSSSKLPAFMAEAPSGFPVATGIVEAQDRDLTAAQEAAEDKALFGESTVDEEPPVMSSKKSKKKDKKKNRKSRDMEEEVERDIRDIEPPVSSSSAADIATGVAAGAGFAGIAAAALAREKEAQDIRDGYEKQKPSSNVNVFDFLDQGDGKTSPRDEDLDRNGHDESMSRNIDDSGYATRYQSVPDISEEPASAAAERYDEDDRDDLESTTSGKRKKKRSSRHGDDMEASIISSKSSKSDDYYDDDKKSRRRSKYDDDVDSPRRYAASEIGDEDKKSRRRSKHDDDYDSPRRYAASEIGGDEDKKPRRRSKYDDDVESPRRYAASEVGDDDSGRKKRRSKRDSDFRDDVSLASTSKLYDDDRERRRRSKRDSEIRDDVSVASTSRLYDDDKRKSKDKEKEKKGGLFGIFSSSKDKDEKDSKKSRSSRDDDEDRERRRKKRSSRSQAGSDDEDDERRRSSKSDRSSRSVEDESRSERRRSRSTKDDYSLASDDIGYKHDTDHPYSRYSSQPPDDIVEEVLSHTEDVESTTSSRRSKKNRDSKDQSFLGVRAEDESAIDAAPLPASPLGDDVPSFEPASAHPDLTVQHASPDLSREVDAGDVELPSLPASRPTSPVDVGHAQDLPTLPDSRPGSPYEEGEEEEEAPKTPPRPSLESLRAASKTAVPFRFRYPNTASSPVVPREMHLPSPATTASPSTPYTPLQTPKTRHAKSLSGDLTREYRPLYLVEKTRKTPDVEDNLPPLPDSASTSRTPSVHDTDDESFHSAVQSPEASFHGSFDGQDGMFDDSHLSHEPDDLLDSQQTTPKAATFPAGVLDLPSRRDSGERGLAGDPETPKKSREPSPSGFGAGELAAGAAMGAAAGLVAHKLLSSHDDDARSVRSDGSFKARDLDDFMGGEADEEEDEEYKRQVEEAARIKAAAEADAEAERQRSPVVSKKAAKKGKKGKRGSKTSLEGPKDPEPTDAQLRERDAQDAFDTWFEAPVKKGKQSKDFDDFLPTQPQDETVYRAKVVEDDDMDDASTLVNSEVTHRGPYSDIKEQVAEVAKVPDVLLQRTPSKKGKKKGKKGSKSGSISLDKSESAIPEDVAEGPSFVEAAEKDLPGQDADETIPMENIPRDAGEDSAARPADKSHDASRELLGGEMSKAPENVADKVEEAGQPQAPGSGANVFDFLDQTPTPYQEKNEQDPSALPPSETAEIEAKDIPEDAPQVQRDALEDAESSRPLPIESVKPASDQPLDSEFGLSRKKSKGKKGKKGQKVDLWGVVAAGVAGAAAGEAANSESKGENFAERSDVQEEAVPSPTASPKLGPSIEVPPESVEPLPSTAVTEEDIKPIDEVAPAARTEDEDLVESLDDKPAALSADDDAQKLGENVLPAQEVSVEDTMQQSSEEIVPEAPSRSLPDEEPEASFQPVARSGSKKKKGKGKKGKGVELWAENSAQEPAENPTPPDESTAEPEPSASETAANSDLAPVSQPEDLREDREAPVFDSEPASTALPVVDQDKEIDFEPVSSSKKKDNKKKKGRKADLWADDAPAEKISDAAQVEDEAVLGTSAEPEAQAQESTLASPEERSDRERLDTREVPDAPVDDVNVAAEASEEPFFEAVTSGKKKKGKKGRKSQQVDIWADEPAQQDLESQPAQERQIEEAGISTDAPNDPIRNVSSEPPTQTEESKDQERDVVMPEASPESAEQVEVTEQPSEAPLEVDPETEFQPIVKNKKKDKKKRKSQIAAAAWDEPVEPSVNDSMPESEAPVAEREDATDQAETSDFVMPKKVKGKGKKRQSTFGSWADLVESSQAPEPIQSVEAIDDTPTENVLIAPGSDSALPTQEERSVEVPDVIEHEADSLEQLHSEATPATNEAEPRELRTTDVSSEPIPADIALPAAQDEDLNEPPTAADGPIGERSDTVVDAVDLAAPHQSDSTHDVHVAAGEDTGSPILTDSPHQSSNVNDVEMLQPRGVLDLPPIEPEDGDHTAPQVPKSVEPSSQDITAEAEEQPAEVGQSVLQTDVSSVPREVAPEEPDVAPEAANAVPDAPPQDNTSATIEGGPLSLRDIVEPAQSREAEEVAAEDEWALPVKKSKKKKGKKSSKQNESSSWDDALPQPEAGVPAIIDESGPSTTGADVTNASRTSQQDQVVAETASPHQTEEMPLDDARAEEALETAGVEPAADAEMRDAIFEEPLHSDLPTDTHNDASLAEPSPRPTKTDQSTGGNAVEVDAEDEWATPVKKKGKKGKKGKKSGAATPAILEETEEPARHASDDTLPGEASRSVEAESELVDQPEQAGEPPVSSIENFPEPVVDSQEVTMDDSQDVPVEAAEPTLDAVRPSEVAADEEWAMPSKKSKKSKKGKKSGHATPMTEETPMPEQTPMSDDLQTGENQVAPAESLPEADAPQQIDLGHSRGEEALPQSTNEPQVRAEEVTAEGEWALPTKKSKKSKKGKKAGSQSAAVAESHVQAEADAAESAPRDESLNDLPASGEPSTGPAEDEIAETPLQRQAEEVADDDDEWALPPKKSKKSQKGNKSGTQTPAAEEIVAGDSQDATEMSNEVLPEPANRDNDRPSPTQEVPDQQKLEKLPEEGAADDEWALPVKKTKRSKKGKKSGNADLVTESDVAAIQEPTAGERSVADEEESRMQTPAAEDPSASQTELGSKEDIDMTEKPQTEVLSDLERGEQSATVDEAKNTQELPLQEVAVVTDDVDPRPTSAEPSHADVDMHETRDMPDMEMLDSRPDEVIADDEWAMPVKKSKKGKKGKKSGTATPATQDDAPILEDAPRDSPPAESSALEHSAEVQASAAPEHDVERSYEPIHDTDVPEVQPAAPEQDWMATAEQGPGMEDEWAMPVKKSKKKGKKGKQAADFDSFTQQDEPMLPADQSTTISVPEPANQDPTSESVPAPNTDLLPAESTTKSPLDDATAPAAEDAPVEVIADDDDEWAMPTKKSKKKGKKNKQSFEAEPAVEEHEAEPVLAADQSPIPAIEPVESSSADLPTENVDHRTAKEASVEAVAADAERAMSAKESKKKGKKGKQLSEPEPSLGQDESAVAADDDDPTSTVEQDPPPIEDQLIGDANENAAQDAPLEVTADDDEWALPAKKSKKKGKKGKQTPVLAPEPDVVEPGAVEQTGTTGDGSREVLAEDGDTPITADLPAHQVKGSPGQDTPLEAAADDEWAMPSKKSKKKGKKSKLTVGEFDRDATMDSNEQQIDSAAEATHQETKDMEAVESSVQNPETTARDFETDLPPDEPLHEDNQLAQDSAQPEPAEADLDAFKETIDPVEPAIEDEWAMPTSKKSKKKGKKGKQSSSVAAEPEPDFAVLSRDSDPTSFNDVAVSPAIQPSASIENQDSETVEPKTDLPAGDAAGQVTAEDEWAIPVSKKDKKKSKKGKKTLRSLENTADADEISADVEMPNAPPNDEATRDVETPKSAEEMSKIPCDEAEPSQNNEHDAIVAEIVAADPMDSTDSPPLVLSHPEQSFTQLQSREDNAHDEAEQLGSRETGLDVVDSALEESPRAALDPAAPEEAVPVDSMEDVQSAPTAPELEADDDWGFSKKKSKKGKKSKRASVAEPQIEEDPAVSAASIEPAPAHGAELERPTSPALVHEPEKSVEQALPALEPEAADAAEWDFKPATKKGKKVKKGKKSQDVSRPASPPTTGEMLDRQGMADNFAVTEEVPQISTDVEQMSTADAELPKKEDEPVAESMSIGNPDAEPNEARDDALDSPHSEPHLQSDVARPDNAIVHSTEPNIAASELQQPDSASDLPILDPSLEVTPVPQETQDEDDWGSVARSKKKGKKSKRASEVVESSRLETSSQEPSIAQTEDDWGFAASKRKGKKGKKNKAEEVTSEPVPSEDDQVKAKEAAVADPAVDPDADAHDKSLGEIGHESMDVDRDTIAASADSEQAQLKDNDQDPVLPEEHSVDETSKDIDTPIVDAEDFSWAPTKKSKKGKKGKKSGVQTPIMDDDTPAASAEIPPVPMSAEDNSALPEASTSTAAEMSAMLQEDSKDQEQQLAEEMATERAVEAALDESPARESEEGPTTQGPSDDALNGPNRDDEFPSFSKVSKKDKRKAKKGKGKAVEELDNADDTPTPAAAGTPTQYFAITENNNIAPMLEDQAMEDLERDVAEPLPQISEIEQPAATEAVPEDEWALPATKKDKKKKKKGKANISTFDAPEVEQQETNIVDELPQGGSTTQLDDSREVPELDSKDLADLSTAAADVPTAFEDQAVPEPADFVTKKSKKDKRKAKKGRALDLDAEQVDKEEDTGHSLNAPDTGTALEQTVEQPVTENLDPVQDKPEPVARSPEAVQGRSSPAVDFTASIAAGLANSGFDPDVAMHDTKLSDSAPRSAALDEPEFDELPLQGKEASRRSSRRSSRRQSRATSVEPGSRTLLEEPSDAKPPPSDDKEFAAILAAGLQGSGFNPDIVQGDDTFAQRRSASPRSLGDEEIEGFSEKHAQPVRGKKGRKQRSLSPSHEDQVARQVPETELIAESSSDAMPLPAGWFHASDPATGKPYYYTAAGEVQWTRPALQEDSESVIRDMEAAASTADPVSEPVQQSADAVRDVEDTREINPEDEWAMPAKKSKRKGKKGAKVAAAAALASGIALAHGASTEPNLATPEDVTSRIVDSKSTEKEEGAGAGMITQSGELPEPLQRSTRSVSTSPQEGRLAGLFPGLERVKRKVPPRQESLAGEQPMKKQEMGSGTDAIVRITSPRPTSSMSREVEMTDAPGLSSDGQLVPEDQSVKKQISAQDLAQPTWSFPSNRDSAAVFPDSPAPPIVQHDHAQIQPAVRDSGYHDTPVLPQTTAARTFSEGSQSRSVDFGNESRRGRSSSHGSSKSPMKVRVEVSPEWGVAVSQGSPEKELPHSRRGTNESLPRPFEEMREAHEYPFPSSQPSRSPPAVESTSKDRSSNILFQSSPSTRERPVASIEGVMDEPFGQPEFEGPSQHRKSHSRSVKPDEPVRSPAHQVKQSRELSSPGPVDRETPITTPMTHARHSSAGLQTIMETSPASPDSPLVRKTRQHTLHHEPASRSLRRSATPEKLKISPRQDLHIDTHASPKRVRSTGGMMSPGDYSGHRSSGTPHTDREMFGIDKTPHGDPSKRVRSADYTRTPASAHDLRKFSPLGDARPASVMSDRSGAAFGLRGLDSARPHSPNISRPLSAMSTTSVRSDRSLRRTDRSVSGDLRGQAKRQEANVGAKISDFAPQLVAGAAGVALASTIIKGKEKSRGAGMEGEFEGYGRAPDSPMSPTRPPSVRKRQSMQIMDLQTRVDQIVGENRALQDAKQKAEQALQDAMQQRDGHASTIQQATAAVAARDMAIQEKDTQIAHLSTTLAQVQQEIARITQENTALSSNASARAMSLETENTHAHAQWQSTARELDELKAKHAAMNEGLQDIVRDEIAAAMVDKDAEIERLQHQLAAKVEEIEELQKQLLKWSQSEDFLNVRNEDYFDSACQQLCQHVQQWVLRFSKFSDNKLCRLSTDINDEKLRDRLDDAILDGSDVDVLLGDRIKRRDVFMSVVMSMVWEYVFTRYLFGMDRDQRKKLKTLEETLTQVGPQKAVAQWRAITLTLLSRRETFIAQRKQDTEAVVQEIYANLSKLLPPPSGLAQQIQDSLRKVLSLAVDLAIEMRTQRAEYIMLPPLKPEYDINGDLVQKVLFNAALMNERSGEFTSNEDLEDRSATVKLVLFPLVVKKGDDLGEGDDEIVVCPAQVLVAKPSNPNKKVVRVMSGAMEIDNPRGSVASFAPTESNMF